MLANIIIVSCWVSLASDSGALKDSLVEVHATEGDAAMRAEDRGAYTGMHTGYAMPALVVEG